MSFYSFKAPPPLFLLRRVCFNYKNKGAFVMKICFLLLGTSLSLIPSLTFAQCVATQDCETLGYTETSCNGGKGVKCPFGNKWACIKSDSECEQQFCDKYGFQYTCSGTGYSGGSGAACGDKYQSCTCASGYEWNVAVAVKNKFLTAPKVSYFIATVKWLGFALRVWTSTLP